MTQPHTFSESLRKALQQSYVWSKQHPTDHLANYVLINIMVDSNIVMQVLSLQVQENYGYTIHSYIDPNHMVWLSQIGMMFGHGNCFEDNGEQVLTCPADVQYTASLIEFILKEVFGSFSNVTVTYEMA